MKNNSTYFLLSIAVMTFLLSFSSCSSDELTRSKAKKMIEAKYEFPLAEYRKWDVLTSTFEKSAQKYVPFGAVAVDKYSSRGKIGQKYNITDLGKAYIIKGNKDLFSGNIGKLYVTNNVYFGKVTGVKSSEGWATVEVDLVRKELTPWGEGYDKIEEGDIIKNKINFERYDDGWRITKPKSISRCVSISSVPELRDAKKLKHLNDLKKELTDAIFGEEKTEVEDVIGFPVSSTHFTGGDNLKISKEKFWEKNTGFFNYQLDDPILIESPSEYSMLQGFEFSNNQIVYRINGRYDDEYKSTGYEMEFFISADDKEADIFAINGPMTHIIWPADVLEEDQIITIKPNASNNKFPKQQTSISNDFYMINVSAFKTETEAKSESRKLTSQGIKSNYLWIPDYNSLTNAQLYSVYIGPFETQNECVNAVEKYRGQFSSCYGLLVSNKNRRVEIKGRNNIKIIDPYYK